ncbi:MAG: alpha/beta hydrolase, partial [Planctomycetes bacterium]|nr:alpha/beta hydrolase [Planctomycetota bacterium]
MFLGLSVIASATLLVCPQTHASEQDRASLEPTLRSVVQCLAPADATPETAEKPKVETTKELVEKEGGLPIRLQTDDKLELGSYYFAPSKTKEKVPGVILVHDQGANAKDLITIAKALSNKKMGVLLLELRGHGDNATEDYDWSKADEKQRKAMWAFMSKDLDAGAKFLSTRKEIHNSKLILVGHGRGCALAATHSIQDRNIVATILIQPAEQVNDFKLKDALIEMDGIPTLILCGKQSYKKMVATKEASDPKQAAQSSVEVSSLKSKPKEVLEDERLSKYMLGWLAAQF